MVPAATPQSSASGVEPSVNALLGGFLGATRPAPFASRAQEDRLPGVGWSRLWSRMSADDRHRAAEAYLEDVEKHPASAEAAVQFIAAESRVRTATVRRWSLSKRAARLARMRGLPPPYLHNFVVSFHRRRRAPMLARFLEVAGIAHAHGFVDVASVTDPAPVERLVAAVLAITAEFPPAEVSLYLDALELQAERPWAHLCDARRRIRCRDVGA